MCSCDSENAAALEELLLEYESKQMAITKGSSIKYETTHTLTHTHTHTTHDILLLSHAAQGEAKHRGEEGLGESKAVNFGSSLLGRSSNKTKKKSLSLSECVCVEGSSDRERRENLVTYRKVSLSEMKAEGSLDRSGLLTHVALLSGDKLPGCCTQNNDINLDSEPPESCRSNRKHL